MNYATPRKAIKDTMKNVKAEEVQKFTKEDIENALKIAGDNKIGYKKRNAALRTIIAYQRQVIKHQQSVIEDLRK